MAAFKIFYVCAVINKHYRCLRKEDVIIRNQDTNIYHMYRVTDSQISLCANTIPKNSIKTKIRLMNVVLNSCKCNLW